MSFLRGAVKVGLARSNGDSERTILHTETVFYASRPKRARMYRYSAAVLKAMIASGPIYLANSNAVFAQAAGTQALPSVVVVDPGQKPKPKPVKRVAPK